MKVFRHLCVLVALGAILASGCGAPHGQPNKGSEVLAPNEVLEFGTLYAENCAGCHGAEGRGGAAIALANPVYLAIADEASIRKVIANGVRGTAMPAFAESAGGMLTDAQIDVITKEIRSRWSQQGVLTRPPRLLMRLNQPGTPNEAKSPIRPTVSLATVQAVAVDARAAPLRTIRFLRWSAIRVFARSSSQAVLNWARPTGEETCQANRCPIRKSPT